MKKIIVITSACGTDTVRQLGGQAAILPMISAAGADGVEIRRELFLNMNWRLCQNWRQKLNASSYLLPSIPLQKHCLPSSMG